MERRRVLGIFLLVQPAKSTRKGLQPRLGNAEGVQSGHGRLPAQFHDLEFPHNGTSLRNLVKPKEAIGDRENGIVSDLTLDIFPDQKSRACQLVSSRLTAE